MGSRKLKASQMEENYCFLALLVCFPVSNLDNRYECFFISDLQNVGMDSKNCCLFKECNEKA